MRDAVLTLARLPMVMLCCALIAGLWAVPTHVPAAEPTATDGVLACRSIEDNTGRLACFDRESARLAGAAVAAAASPAAPNTSNQAVSPASAASSSLDPKQTFGLSIAQISAREVAAGSRPRDAASITAHIARFAAGANGRYVFTLDNQQVWQQLLADGDLDSKPGDTVVISRGMLGSFWMKAQSGRGCKVMRLR